jgi:hypothetical protein
VRKTLKKYLIPHKGNRHRPHLLRDEAVLFIIGGLLLMELFFLFGFPIVRRSSFFASILPAILTEETNISRVASGAPTLTYNPLLEKAATLKARDMAEKGYFAHTSPLGVTPWYWLNEARYEFSAAGENLAVNFFDSKDLAEAWMNSPTHRANVLNPTFSEIGIGFAEGVYDGRDTVFAVEFFGTPAPVTPVVAFAASEESPLPAVSQGGDAVVPSAPSVKAATTPLIIPNLPFTESSVRDVAIIRRAAASPRRAMASVISILITVFAAALAIKIFITAHARRAQQHGLIINGVIFLIIMVSVLALNQFVGLLPSVI